MSTYLREIRIFISPKEMRISKAANFSREGGWGKDFIKLELSVAMIFHKVLNRYRLTRAFEKNDYEILGKMLFNILTTTQKIKGTDQTVKDLFLDGITETISDPNRPRCRIYLSFEDDVGEMATLPWEYLQVKEDDSRKILPFYIGADPRLQFDFIRSVEGDRSQTNPDLNKELNVVLIVSNPLPTPYDPNKPDPDKLPPLTPQDLKEMFKNLHKKYQVIQTYGRENDKPKKSSFVEELRDIVDKIEGPYILHFYGHAKFDEKDQTFYIGFTQENNTVYWLSDKEFANFFGKKSEFRKPEMIFLQACESGQVGEWKDGAFPGLAISLAMENIPAVIGMQNIVTEAASNKFAECFYESILMGEDVAMAVTRGRRLLGLPAGEDSEFCYSDNTFGTPVLFISTPEPIRMLPVKKGLYAGETKMVAKICSECRKVYERVDPARTRCYKDDCRGTLKPIESAKEQSVANFDSGVTQNESSQETVARPDVKSAVSESK